MCILLWVDLVEFNTEYNAPVYGRGYKHEMDRHNACVKIVVVDAYI